MKNYIVSQDRKSGLWYAHMRGYQHVPVSGSFSEKRRDAAEYAKMYNGLPHKVEEIERKRREAFEFQSTRPMRGATAKVYKITLHTFATKGNSWTISRKTLPFKAFCRLQIGKNFSICGANRCGNFCELLLRTIRSSVLPEGRSACSQNAQFYSHTFSRDNRNADCLFPDP